MESASDWIPLGHFKCPVGECSGSSSVSLGAFMIKDMMILELARMELLARIVWMLWRDYVKQHACPKKCKLVMNISI